MTCPIAIIGMACRYPDADTVDQLFENSLAGRQSFRRIPEQRLSANYFDENGTSKDRAYMRQAALLRGFRFDRDRFRVSLSSYEATDLTHWLALTVAHEAIADIRFRKQGVHPDKDAIRVVVGNSLTGEFSRAGLMRLRWPYVRAVVERHLQDHDEAGRERLLRAIEAEYKSPFPIPNEDSLAGGLANTIAGRICNHFDFKGGGYTVDGACSSSLLAVADACSALAAGDADMVLAGGVDLSIDPFELIGFSRTAALARTDMRVYDECSEGFWPGEGCGFVALMRLDDALDSCEHIHAVIRGWGMSSDGQGGLTRPEPAGQAIALRRCYARAGYDIGSVGYFEGHGTGTKVGDAAELTALTTARCADGGPKHAAIISSIKANIGHTKAAAGLAGLLRATKCVSERVLPPTTACHQPLAMLTGNPAKLRVSDRAMAWDGADVPRRAGISAMGFGGINTHVTIEEAPPVSRVSVPAAGDGDLTRFWTGQELGLFLFAANRREDLIWSIGHLAGFADRCSRAELHDLAAELARRATRGALSPWKAAVVATNPAQLTQRLNQLREHLEKTEEAQPLHLAPADGLFFSGGGILGRIGLIFSGQAAPVRVRAGSYERCFEPVRRVYQTAGLECFAGRDDTAAAQPAIAAASLAGIDLLRGLGIEGDLALGHSLGELAALHWAGCYDGDTLLKLARMRGQAMADDPQTGGAMIAISAGRQQVAALITGQPHLYISNLNGPRQTVVAGERAAVEALAVRLRQAGIGATILRLRQAFHTPAMAAVAETLGRTLDSLAIKPLQRDVISTVTAGPLAADTDITQHLRRQVVEPVNFLDALTLAAKHADLFIEVGPGDVFAGLAANASGVPALSLDVGGSTLTPFLQAVAAAYVLDRAPGIGELFRGRFIRPYRWDWQPDFLSNPCETIPTTVETLSEGTPAPVPAENRPPTEAFQGDALDCLRGIVADITGLPAWTLQGSSRMLSDLHLNSITVGSIVTRFAATLGRRPVSDPTAFVNASLEEIRAAIEALGQSGKTDPDAPPAGLEDWVRQFAVEWVPAPPLPPARHRERGKWQAFGETTEQTTQLLQHLNNGPHGDGILVWLDTPPDAGALLQAAQHCDEMAGRQQTTPRLVVVQDGWGASGFTRSFHLESPKVPVLVVNVTSNAPASDWILGEIDAAPDGFREIFLDASGGRREPSLVPLPSGAAEANPLGIGDVVLVSGGGKGISAECGFQLARRTGCALLILGRSRPQDSAELRDNLTRLGEAGIRVSYQLADVTDSAQVAAAIAAGTRELGAPVSAILHGAGLNQPCAVAALSPQHLTATIAPKVGGLRHLLRHVDPDQLKMLVTFSSIIGRIGLRGEADYALANEWLSRETETFQSRHPHCRCRALEWSVWSGTGMGERLGSVDALASQGITPISVDRGIEEFLRTVETPGLPVRIVISGRFGGAATFAQVPPPALRFLETVPVFYPQVEVVAECHLSPATDPYLEDHALDGECLFPAVMALEAMGQAAFALTGADMTMVSPQFRQVAFRKALLLPQHGPLTVRVVAQAKRDGSIALAIRCSSTDFQVNHVEAVCTLEPLGELAAADAPAQPLLPSHPENALYDTILFQKGRFRRIQGYDLIEARRCGGQLTPAQSTAWFAGGRPAFCLLGDPGARDGALHSVQACMPHKILVPVSVESVETTLPASRSSPARFSAIEIADRGDELVYDLTLADHQGRVVERWRGLTYRVVRDVLPLQLGAPPLAASYLERMLAARRPEAGARVSLSQSGRPDDSLHRPDGKPEAAQASADHRSISHSAPWRLRIDSRRPTGCDLQTVARKPPQDWQLLLGQDGAALAAQLSAHLAEPLDVSATRVWTAHEAAKKAGRAWTTPLTFDLDSAPHWTLFKSGDVEVFSTTIQAAGEPHGRCVAVALGR